MSGPFWPAAFSAPWLYLTLEFGGAFRHHIGSGLQEHTAMLFLVLTMGLVCRKQWRVWRRMAAAGLSAMIGFWLRMDHLGALAGAGLLCQGQSGSSLTEIWRDWAKSLRSQIGPNVLFYLLLAVAVFSVPLRNGIMGGEWVFTARTNLAHLWCSSWPCVWRNFQRLFWANELGLPPTSWILSLFTCAILLPGTAVGLWSLFYRKGPWADYPLGLGVLLLGLLAPYLWVQVVAYPPRFSIHLLPPAVLSMVLFLYHTWKVMDGRFNKQGD